MPNRGASERFSQNISNHLLLINMPKFLRIALLQDSNRGFPFVIKTYNQNININYTIP